MELSDGVRRALLLAQSRAKGEVAISDLLNAMEKVIKNNSRSLGGDINAEIAELVNYIEKRQLDTDCFGKLAASFSHGSTYPVSALLRQAENAAKRNSENRLALLRLFLVIREYEISPNSGETPDYSMPCEEYASDSNSLVDLAEAVVNSTKLRDYLLGLVQGQSHAVNVFANAVFNSTLHSDIEAARSSKPRCILLFAGPPGVGKTYLAELSAKHLRLPYMRFDMSTFSDKEVGLFHLIGINKSYKSAKAGVLTTFVQENPRCILLFDEIEKSHLNIIHLFLQILDAGVLRACL